EDGIRGFHVTGVQTCALPIWAGRVVAVGTGVDQAWVGRRVAVRTGTGYAEQVLAHEEEIMPIPDGLALREAAALVHDGVTALNLHRLGAPQEGEWVQVSVAAGGV